MEVVEGLLLYRVDLHCGELAVDGEVELAPDVLPHVAEAVRAIGYRASPVAGVAHYPPAPHGMPEDSFLLYQLTVAALAELGARPYKASLSRGSVSRI